MIQLLPKAAFNAGWGGGSGSSNIGVLGGEGDFAGPTTFGMTYTRAPVAFDSTFRNLTILAPNLANPFPADVTITLYVDGAPTTQTATIPFGDTVAVSTGEDVFVSAGQDINYHYAGPADSLGHDISFCLEREGVGNIYGLTSGTSGYAADEGSYGGAFNNGARQGYVPGVTVDDSLYYSLAALDGTMTTLMLRCYNQTMGVSAYTAWARVDRVVQDGTGGTVDTTCVLTGDDTVATSTFSLPITLGQRVDIVVYRTGINGPFDAKVAIGVGYLPEIDGGFMCCGGSNDVVDNLNESWKWVKSEQLAIGPDRALTPISAAGLTVTGLAVERADPPGTGAQWVHTIQRSLANTAAVVTIADDDTFGLIDGLSESFVSGQTIILNVLPSTSPTPGLGRLYWGLAARVGPTPEPEPIPSGVATVTLTTRRLRRASHLTDEHQWLTYDKFQVDLQAGVGLTDGQGEDPQVMVRWSNDGGHTWSNEHWTTAGRQGARKTRVIVRQTGRARVRTFEIVVSDPVAWFLAAAYLDVTPGNGT